MEEIGKLIFAFGILFVVWLSIAVFQSITGSDASAALNQPVWEYIVLHRDTHSSPAESNQDYLNRLGAQGWELCCITKDDDWLYKRMRYPAKATP